MLVRKISTTPSSGPAIRAIAALTPTSEPTRIQRRADECAAAAQRGPALTALELDDRREQAPANRKPDRDRDEEHGRREQDPGR